MENRKWPLKNEEVGDQKAGEGGEEGGGEERNPNMGWTRNLYSGN